MTETADLIFELGCEELPPKSIVRLSEALGHGIAEGIKNQNLHYKDIKCLATPRRLAVVVNSLETIQPDRKIEKRGPSIKAAFKSDGSTTKAAEGFARSCDTSVDKLEVLKTEKGEWLVFNEFIKGRKTQDLITEIIIQSLSNLPIAKRMRWGSGDIEFARPVHWSVLVFGGAVVETEILGLKTGKYTHGHRFHAPQGIEIRSAEIYEETLYCQGKVIVDIEKRKQIIRQAAVEKANDLGGIAWVEEDLLEEIAAINEWPVPVVGEFNQRFLQLPVEVLITTMQSNQKYFPVKNSEGGLLPNFITFSNIESKNPDSVKKGNERVIAPRLADAEFFWNQDRKIKLEERVAGLEKIIFQQKLGTLSDKTERVIFISEHIASLTQVDVNLVRRAALLAKTDLLTEMVGEFASLQGIMGRYYALADGENPEVAVALEQQYYPKQAGGQIPTDEVAKVLAIADKIDTLAGIFSAGLIPTGDKDPYALRRAALGVLRILIEGELQLDVIDLIDISLAQFKHDFNKLETRKLVIDFVFERLRGYCLDNGYQNDEFEAVRSVMPGSPLDFMKRLEAVQTFRQLPEAESLSAANKRIKNILKKAKDQISDNVTIQTEPQEKDLLTEAQAVWSDIEPMLNNKDYKNALNRLALLKPKVDEFFDHVMVNTEDEALRKSRLALLNMLASQFMKIADISKLQA